MSEPSIETTLARLDAMNDDDIDYSDAPQPDLALWIRESRRFQGWPVDNGPPMGETNGS